MSTVNANSELRVGARIHSGRLTQLVAAGRLTRMWVGPGSGQVSAGGRSGQVSAGGRSGQAELGGDQHTYFHQTIYLFSTITQHT